MYVCIAERESNEKVFSVYTDQWYFEFSKYSNEVTSAPNTLGLNPITEYPSEEARLGVFEVAMPLLDALDELQSNRMDDIVQFVNSFLAILGGELDNDTYQKLNDCKTLCLPEGTDAKYLSATLSQADVQALKNDIYQSILFPNPESAYLQDMDYYNEQMKKWEPVEVDETEDEGEGDVRVS